MAVLMPHPLALHPAKHERRTATAVMAGAFDMRPTRDVLTSLLNGVAPYKVVEKDEEMRRSRKKEKKERERERQQARAAAKSQELPDSGSAVSVLLEPSGASTSDAPTIRRSASHTAAFWRSVGNPLRPTINIASGQRTLSVTPPPSTSPPPMPSTPASTPGPSNSSSTSRTSSKRPHTPDDFDDFDHQHRGMRHSSPSQPPRKKRVAVKKGWKGWVEGSPPPSEKLINLDAVPILQERRTRSGKNFDAIGVGKEGWV